MSTSSETVSVPVPAAVAVPERRSDRPFEHQLYERIEERMGPAAHSYYNGLIRRMTSYARILEREHTGRC